MIEERRETKYRTTREKSKCVAVMLLKVRQELGIFPKGGKGFRL
jgi:hypothetical protein